MVEISDKEYKELRARLKELDIFNKATSGRELKMIELGKPAKYSEGGK
ncbi:MAG: hypothetical protein ABIH22_03620 [Candidatus Margulisiibacteriota bacterium]